MVQPRMPASPPEPPRRSVTAVQAPLVLRSPDGLRHPARTTAPALWHCRTTTPAHRRPTAPALRHLSHERAATLGTPPPALRSPNGCSIPPPNHAFPLAHRPLPLPMSTSSCVTIRLVPKVTFLPAGETFEFESGKLPYKGHGLPESLLDVAMNFGFHLEHACGGNCACTTCHVVVKQGDQNLSEIEDDELDRVEQAADFQVNSRLGCQAVVKGDVVVEIPAWNRNYISEGGGSILGDAIPGKTARGSSH
jgi:ferredoxin, 2Fe-2S